MIGMTHKGVAYVKVKAETLQQLDAMLGYRRVLLAPRRTGQTTMPFGASFERWWEVMLGRGSSVGTKMGAKRIVEGNAYVTVAWFLREEFPVDAGVLVEQFGTLIRRYRKRVAARERLGNLEVVEARLGMLAGFLAGQSDEFYPNCPAPMFTCLGFTATQLSWGRALYDRKDLVASYRKDTSAMLLGVAEALGMSPGLVARVCLRGLETRG